MTTPPLAAAPRSLESVRFIFKADSAVRGGLTAAEKKLFFGTEAGSLYALDSDTGALLWQQAVVSGIASIPAVGRGTVYFTSWDNALHALDAQTGRERWVRSLGRNVGTSNYWEYYSSSPIVSNEVYVGSGDGRFYAIDPFDGKVRWSTDVGARIRSTAAISESHVVFGTDRGQVIALDRSSGRLLWIFATKGAAQEFALKENDTRSVQTPPIVSGNLVIAGGRDGNIYGIDLRSGAQRWMATHDGGSWILALATDGKTVYSGSGSALLLAASDLNTGKEIWRKPTANAMWGGVSLVDGVIVSNGSKGTLFGIAAYSGEELWRFRLTDMAFSKPAVAAGAVFTASDDGLIYGLNTSPSTPVQFERLVHVAAVPPNHLVSFTPDALNAVESSLAAAGYKRANDADILKALKSSSTRVRTIIVLSDAHLPKGADGRLLRKFVESGGTLAMLGTNPASFAFDKTGAPTTVEDERGAAAFGMLASPRERYFGFNVSTFAPSAAQWGLRGHFASLTGGVHPSQVSLVLARDRLGMATAWAKQFGDGGLLIQLPADRYRPRDISNYANAIQLLAAESAKKPFR